MAARPRLPALPRLTVQGAARLLHVPVPVFTRWVVERCAPTARDWARWTNETDPANTRGALPEAILRWYLTEHRRAPVTATRRGRHEAWLKRQLDGLRPAEDA